MIDPWHAPDRRRALLIAVLGVATAAPAIRKLP
jgi:hypothetical protein